MVNVVYAAAINLSMSVHEYKMEFKIEQGVESIIVPYLASILNFI